MVRSKRSHGTSFHSLTRDILIHTRKSMYHTGYDPIQFPFPHAGHTDLYLNNTSYPFQVDFMFPFPHAGHTDLDASCCSLTWVQIFSFHSLTWDILIYTKPVVPIIQSTCLFPFPHAGHTDSYLLNQLLFSRPACRFHSLTRDILIYILNGRAFCDFFFQVSIPSRGTYRFILSLGY